MISRPPKNNIDAMKLFIALFALAASASAFQCVSSCAPLPPPLASADAVTCLSALESRRVGMVTPKHMTPAVSVRTAPTTMLVSDKYDAEKAWIRVPGNKWVDLKELTPLYAFLGTIFFVHDYCHFQLGMLAGETFI